MNPSDLSPEQQEAYNEFLKTIQDQIDPRDYLAPSMREIAKMPLDQLEQENKLVEAKQSTRSRSQRDLIQSRWEYEQTKQETNEDGQSN
jgi:hypothetical protein